jgi:Chaperone of endosialidase
MKTTIPQLKQSMNRGPFRLVLLLIPLALAWFALSSAARALAVDPPPDGGYPNGNTAEGESALLLLTDGAYNTALGYLALSSNTTSYQNTATGAYSLIANTDGFGNTANGAFTLTANTTGCCNTALGVGALNQNTTGYSNTATGLGALQSNTTGFSNTATGVNSLFDNTTGYNNTAVGDQALLSDTAGASNTAVGVSALVFTTGSNNIALGAGAGSHLTSGSNNIYVGSNGTSSESRTIHIGEPRTHGRTFIAGISGVTVAGGVGVIVDTKGQLGTVVSSKRFKDSVKPMEKVSEAILALKPVTFRYKHELDPDGIPQFGLVAEDVEKVNPDLVARDEQGKPYTVRYEAVNAMLLNEFLKEHRKVEQMQKQIDALTAGLQKVSAQLEASKAAPQTVLNRE